MKAVLCKQFGAPDALAIADIASPAVGPGTVKIEVRACGVNFPDLLLIQGLYQFKPTFPFSPGLEVAGDIIELGANVEGLQIGGRVLATMMYGGFAEEVVVPATSILPMPDNMPYDVGAAFPLAYGTAHVALAHRGQLHNGETLLVLGAAGGVGLAAVEIGKLIGASVIAAASTCKKLEIARRQGADETINYSSEDLRERIKTLTMDRGVDVIFDPVGGELFDVAFRRIAWEGRYLVIGFASGKIPALPANIALLKNASLVGLFWGAYLLNDPDVIRRSFDQLLRWYTDGQLMPRVQATLPLDKAADALRAIMERRVLGKIVLVT